MRTFISRNKEEKDTISISAISKELEADYTLEKELKVFLTEFGIKRNKLIVSSRTYENKFLEFITRFDENDEEKEFSKNLFKDNTGSYAVPIELKPFFKFLLIGLSLKTSYFKNYNNIDNINSGNFFISEAIAESFFLGNIIVGKFSYSEEQQIKNMYLVDQLLNFSIMKKIHMLGNFVEALLLNSEDLSYHQQVAIMDDVVKSFEKAFVQSSSEIILEDILSHFEPDKADEMRQKYHDSKK